MRRQSKKPAPFSYTFPTIAPALPAPFPTRDNGEHLYFEDRTVLVLCPHGSSIWVGLAKDGGGYAPLTTGENPAAVMAETRRLRAIPRFERPSTTDADTSLVGKRD